MNVQDYISSGIVESYVLGLASPEEQKEFEQLCLQYPELVEARTAFEISLEQQAMQNAVPPPGSLKAEIQAALQQGSDAKVVPIQRAPVVKTNWMKYAIAASVALLIASMAWNLSLQSKNNELQANYNKLDSTYNNTVARLDDIEKDLKMITGNPNVKMAAMKGMPDAPTSVATVYWDSTSKDVYLLVTNLPKPASDKQYQLWALLDGKPIDLGMIDNNYLLTQNRLLLRMKNVSSAQAFAVTLEDKGGSPTPKGKMYVLGNL